MAQTKDERIKFEGIFKLNKKHKNKVNMLHLGPTNKVNKVVKVKQKGKSWRRTQVAGDELRLLEKTCQQAG